MKSLQFGLKGMKYKVGARKTVVALSILHQENRKDELRDSKKLSRPHTTQSQGCKRVNSFERLCVEKEPQGTLLVHPSLPRDVSTQGQPSRHSEATVAMVNIGPAGGRPCHYPCGAGSGGMQNVRVMESWRFPPTS